MLRFSHGLIDGIGSFMVLNLLSDKCDLTNIPYIVPRSLKHKILTFLTIFITPFSPFFKKEKGPKQSAIFEHDENSDDLMIGKYFSLDTIKKASHSLGCTVNDLALTALSLAFHRFALDHKIEDLKKDIYIQNVVNFRYPPKTV